MRRISAQGVGVASVFFFWRRRCGGGRLFRFLRRIGDEDGEELDQAADNQQGDEEDEQYGHQCFN